MDYWVIWIRKSTPAKKIYPNVQKIGPTILINGMI